MTNVVKYCRLNENTFSSSTCNKETCGICLEDFNDGEKTTILDCSGKHRYHSDCIVLWLKNSPSCPTCRTDLTNEISDAGKIREKLSKMRFFRLLIFIFFFYLIFGISFGSISGFDYDHIFNCITQNMIACILIVTFVAYFRPKVINDFEEEFLRQMLKPDY